MTSLDQILPSFQRHERHNRWIDAPPQSVCGHTHTFRVQLFNEIDGRNEDGRQVQRGDHHVGVAEQGAGRRLRCPAAGSPITSECWR